MIITESQKETSRWWTLVLGLMTCWRRLLWDNVSAKKKSTDPTICPGGQIDVWEGKDDSAPHHRKFFQKISPHQNKNRCSTTLRLHYRHTLLSISMFPLRKERIGPLLDRNLLRLIASLKGYRPWEKDCNGSFRSPQKTAYSVPKATAPHASDIDNKPTEEPLDLVDAKEPLDTSDQTLNPWITETIQSRTTIDLDSAICRVNCFLLSRFKHPMYNSIDNSPCVTNIYKYG